MKTQIVHQFIKIACAILLFTQTNVVAQKGLKVGLGAYTMTGNADAFTYADSLEVIKVKTPISFTLNLDYHFSQKLSLKSGLEYRRQGVQINDYQSFTTESYGIPLLIQYNFINKKSFSLGVVGGVFMDRLVHNQSFLTQTTQKGGVISEEVKIDMGTYKDASGSSLHFQHLSLRLGINASKKLAENKIINFFATFQYRRSTPDFYAKFERSYNYAPNVDLTLYYDKYAPLARSGIQFGLYYTFGTLTFK